MQSGEVLEWSAFMLAGEALQRPRA